MWCKSGWVLKWVEIICISVTNKWAVGRGKCVCPWLSFLRYDIWSRHDRLTLLTYYSVAKSFQQYIITTANSADCRIAVGCRVGRRGGLSPPRLWIAWTVYYNRVWNQLPTKLLITSLYCLRATLFTGDISTQHIMFFNRRLRNLIDSGLITELNV